MHRPCWLLQIVVASQWQSSILVQELLRCTPLGHSFEGSLDVGEVQADLSRPHFNIDVGNQVLRLIFDELLSLIPVVCTRILTHIRSLQSLGSNLN